MMRFLLGFFVGLTLGYGLASLLTLPGDEQREPQVQASSA
jgi:hypothetical protein